MEGNGTQKEHTLYRKMKSIQSQYSQSVPLLSSYQLISEFPKNFLIGRRSDW